MLACMTSRSICSRPSSSSAAARLLAAAPNSCCSVCQLDCHWLMPPSCSTSMAPSTMAARPGARWAASRISCVVTGVCGRHSRAAGPCRPASSSCSSPISACVSSAMSCPILPSVPHSIASSVPSRTKRSRVVCHEAAGIISPRASASRWATARLRSVCGPCEDNVPSGPPNCSTATSSSAARRWRRLRCRGSSHPASFHAR